MDMTNFFVYHNYNASWTDDSHNARGLFFIQSDVKLVLTQITIMSLQPREALNNPILQCQESSIIVIFNSCSIRDLTVTRVPLIIDNSANELSLVSTSITNIVGSHFCDNNNL
jgi:hypothetical protein